MSICVSGGTAGKTIHEGANDMSQESELQRLERFVEKLLTSFSELRAEKASLLQQLGERDRQIEDLRNNVSVQEMERGEISQRVGKLVTQIEEWENSLDEAAAAVPESPSIEESILDEYDVQEEIEEDEAEIRGEEEGRVQHNLFSMKSAQR
jgi:chromosome segregation ATPase